MKTKIVIAIGLFLLNTLLCLAQNGDQAYNDDEYYAQLQKDKVNMNVLRNIKKSIENACDSIDYHIKRFDLTHDLEETRKNYKKYENIMKARINTYNVYSRMYNVDYIRMLRFGLKEQYSEKDFDCIRE